MVDVAKKCGVDAIKLQTYRADTITIDCDKKDFKICVVCQRPFNWRKKWEKVWNDVKYCSEKCRRSKSKIQIKK